MPKVNERRNRDGATTYFWRFRLDGIQSSLAFPRRAEAAQFARDVEQRGAAGSGRTTSGSRRSPSR